MSIGYLRNGRQVEIIEKTDSGYIVDPYIEVRVAIDDVDIQPSGYPTFEPEVFESPPKNIYHKSIKDAQLRLDDLNSQANEACSKINSAKLEQQKIAEELKNIPEIKDILCFIKGDFGYFACPEKNRQPFIEKKEEFIKQGSRHDYGEFRLLSLYGRAKGDLTWRINQYSDGSGGSDLAIPCKTEEDAIEVVGEYFIKKITAMQKDNKNFYGVYEKIQWLIDNGFEIDMEWKEKSTAYEIESLKKEVKNQTQYISDYQNRAKKAQDRLDVFINQQ